MLFHLEKEIRVVGYLPIVHAQTTQLTVNCDFMKFWFSMCFSICAMTETYHEGSFATNSAWLYLMIINNISQIVSELKVHYDWKFVFQGLAYNVFCNHCRICLQHSEGVSISFILVSEIKLKNSIKLFYFSGHQNIKILSDMEAFEKEIEQATKRFDGCLCSPFMWYIAVPEIVIFICAM